MTDDNSLASPANVQDLGLASLALGAGCIDVLAFVRLGGALPSAMTGNTALLGLTLGRGHPLDAVPFLLAFVGFVVGTAVAVTTSEAIPSSGRTARATVSLLGQEAVLLASFAVLWQLAARPVADTARNALILLAAAGMGMQGVAARLTGRSGLNTIVFTSTLSAIVGSVTRTLLLRPSRQLDRDTRRHIGIFGVYFLGAIMAGLAIRGDAHAIAILPLVAVLGAIACYYRGY